MTQLESFLAFTILVLAIIIVKLMWQASVLKKQIKQLEDRVDAEDVTVATLRNLHTKGWFVEMRTTDKRECYCPIAFPWKSACHCGYYDRIGIEKGKVSFFLSKDNFHNLSVKDALKIQQEYYNLDSNLRKILTDAIANEQDKSLVWRQEEIY